MTLPKANAPEVKRDGAQDAPAHLILAHGAGAGMDSPWLARITALLVAAQVCVHRFEFGYMAARRQGGRRPPPKAESLTGEYELAVSQVAHDLRPGQRLVIGGKSMGGRVASLVADRLYPDVVSGLVCLGYPFHPVGRPAQLRTAHLADLKCTTLILQGTRDPFGTRDEVTGYTLSPAITVDWIDDGDHDFKGAGRGTMERVAEKIATFAGAR